MNILIDLRWALDTSAVYRGTGRVARATIKQLATAHSIDFVVPHKLDKRIFDYLAQDIEDYTVYEFPYTPRKFSLAYADVCNAWFENLYSTGVFDVMVDLAPHTMCDYKTPQLNVPYVVVFYDVIPLIFNFPTIPYIWHMAQRYIARANGVISISRRAWIDFESYMQVMHNNMVVALPPLDFVESDAPLSRDRKPYVLTITGPQVHKDTLGIIDVFSHFPDDLRQQYHIKLLGIGGYPIHRVEAELKALREDVSLEILGHVSDDELVGLYSDASASYTGSLYEGLGLPPLEGALLGAPVLRTDGGALSELAGVGECFSPRDYGDAAAKLIDIFKNADYYATRHQRAAQEFRGTPSAYLGKVNRVLEQAIHDYSKRNK